MNGCMNGWLRNRPRWEKNLPQHPPKNCVNCPSKADCKANEKGQKIFTTHIRQEYLDIVESIRKTDLGKNLCTAKRNH